jgi:hypothetical protein
MALFSITKRFLELAAFMSQCIKLSSFMTLDSSFNKIVAPPLVKKFFAYGPKNLIEETAYAKI